jgi:hypothetical protein
MRITIEEFDDPGMVNILKCGIPDDRKKRMAECFKVSATVWMGLADSKVACIWGVALPTLLSENAYLWLWTSEVVKDHPFIFVRKAQMVIKGLLKEYASVVGVVDLNDVNPTSSIRWLKLLGAKFGNPTSNGLIPFQIIKA